LNDLLAELQGPNGSGQLFAADAETLMLIATSHYELEEWGYELLLAKVRKLNEDHQARIAIGHAASMGCHLRFGFEAQCGRDTVALRDDNVADYPWLCFALAATMRAYDRIASAFAEASTFAKATVDKPAGQGAYELAVVEEALLNGLTPDARAFVGVPPASLSVRSRSRAVSRAVHGAQGRADGPRASPVDRIRAYSPLSFFFNFSHNVLKGTVVDALLWGEAWDLSLNDLLTGVPRAGVAEGSQQLLATTLMGYARSNPDRIRGR
jgi:hypothetical protein